LTLEDDFAQLESKLHARMGIAISAVGNGKAPITLGHWHDGPAWSTIKVPLVIAGYRAEDPPHITDEMTLAITESDNSAAESIWGSLGDPVTAAHKVEDVLRQTGDPTIVQSQRVRPGFTAFGQTNWSLTNQVRFTSVAVCDSQTTRYSSRSATSTPTRAGASAAFQTPNSKAVGGGHPPVGIWYDRSESSRPRPGGSPLRLQRNPNPARSPTVPTTSRKWPTG
jgi:beta-lactamase class A